jgi:hypothetical protein
MAEPERLGDTHVIKDNTEASHAAIENHNYALAELMIIAASDWKVAGGDKRVSVESVDAKVLSDAIAQTNKLTVLTNVQDSNDFRASGFHSTPATGDSSEVFVATINLNASDVTHYNGLTPPDLSGKNYERLVRLLAKRATEQAITEAAGKVEDIRMIADRAFSNVGTVVTSSALSQLSKIESARSAGR